MHLYRGKGRLSTLLLNLDAPTRRNKTLSERSDAKMWETSRYKLSLLHKVGVEEENDVCLSTNRAEQSHSLSSRIIVKTKTTWSGMFLYFCKPPSRYKSGKKEVVSLLRLFLGG